MQWPVVTAGRMSTVECQVGATGDLTGDRHDVVLRGAAPAQHHLVLAGEEPIGGGHRGLLVQDTDGAILPDAIGHFIGVHPQGQLAGQQLVQLGLTESNLASHFTDDGVHFVVDANAAVARALGWLFRKPVVFVVLCQCLLKSPAENLESLLAHAAPGPEEAGEETYSGSDLREHICSLPGPAGLAHVFRGSGNGGGGGESVRGSGGTCELESLG